MDNKWFCIIDKRYEIPEYMRESLTLYVEEHVMPGDFLQAILENKFVEAVARADYNNVANLPAYANYLYNHIPFICWGNKERVQNWVNRKDEKNDSPN